MTTSRGTPVRELAWTVVGASAGSLVHHWTDYMWPGHTLVSMPVLSSVAAGFVGFALVASIRAPVRTVLIAAGGAAASISAVATQAVSATPGQSIIELAVFFACAVLGVLSGMLVASYGMRNSQGEEPN